MKFSLKSLVAVLVAGASIVSASLHESPTLFGRQNDMYGKQCFTDDDCSGICQCSQPAEWGWKCVDFDPNPPMSTSLGA
ncbi:hypothetical protein F4821DRAFT_259195 [Hypoxylon rubiginosum]|uniref:Uncharacterized protein n=1 Tax=Hypoxylon rubiginosum TaxID=110542 RepID=A0ACC0D3J7_9PEZI|nr:hypothetical protein F4821DRAFT_259195 [Hypoxylon rubiginosum]